MSAGIKANLDGSGAIQVGGVDVIGMDTSGNVGVGTTSPNTRLEIKGAGTSIIDSVLRINNPNTSAYSTSILDLYSNGATRAQVFGQQENNTSGGSAVIQVTNSSGALTEQARITAAGLFQFNSGYGSAATAYGCRAWVNANGITDGTFAGGSSTVTRAAGSTIATVTTTNDHGLITGNFVYAATGVVAGLYTVTVLTTKTFTITTVATTALTAASITFTVSTIRATGNISSIAHSATGQYAVNFSVAMPDANYSVTGTASTTDAFSVPDNTTVGPRNLTAAGFYCQTTDGTSNTFVDALIMSLAVFR